MARRSPLRPERHKYTAEEMEEYLTSLRDRVRRWRESRRPADEAERLSRLRRRTVLALGAGLVITAGAGSWMDGQYRSASAASAEQVSQLEARVRVQEAAADVADSGLGEQVRSTTEAAQAAAQDVAGLQSRYAQLFSAAESDPGSQDGTPSQSALATVEHRRELEPYFSPDSLVVDEEMAYSWSSVAGYDEASTIDPRYPWYLRYDGRSYADPGSYSWSVASVAVDASPEEDAMGVLTVQGADVVWTCDADDGTRLAWASARFTYDAEAGSGLLGDLRLTWTAAGSEQGYPREG